MKIGYYPGCSLLGTAQEYNESVRAILPALGVELVDVPDWNCCGSSAAHNLDHDLALALPARIHALAESTGVTEMLVPCAACYSRLVTAQHELAEDADLRAKISNAIGMEYKGTVKPLNILEFLAKFTDIIKEKTSVPFQRDVACYYGCLLVRPPKIMQFDRPEDPRAMDDIMAALGATPIEWPFKVECCGAGLSISRTDLVGKLSGKIVGNAVSNGAEAIIVACPMCHSNLDMRRKDINKSQGKKYTVPVLYITQAIGLALGLKEKELGLQRHMVKVKFPEKKAPVQAAVKPTHPVQTEQTEEA